MKLYATVTSDRASKGQGGNSFIDVYINDEEGSMLAKMRIDLATDYVGQLITASIDFREDIYVNGHHWLDAEIRDREYKTKGEKQKGDKLNSYIDNMFTSEGR
jgi:hypothetical protein